VIILEGGDVTRGTKNYRDHVIPLSEPAKASAGKIVSLFSVASATTPSPYGRISRPSLTPASSGRPARPLTIGGRMISGEHSQRSPVAG
jgi:hypothetical protein